MAEVVKARDGNGDEIERTAVNDDGSVTVTLRYPVKVMAEERTSLILKRPRGKQMRLADEAKVSVTGLLKLICQLANIPSPSADELDGADIMAMGRVIGGFISPSPEIGEG